MASVRWTTTNRRVPEIPGAADWPITQRNVKPVAGQGGIESDRRRTVREDSTPSRAIPVAVADDAMSDAREVANELKPSRQRGRPSSAASDRQDLAAGQRGARRRTGLSRMR